MSISSSSHEIRISTIQVDGRLDAVRAVDLRAEISAALDAALAKGMKDCRAKGGDLRIVSPRNDDATRVFALTRFDQVFTMGDSAQALVASW